MNRLDIASLFCQFLQLNRSAVATIEMIAELIDSIVELPHRRWYIGICFYSHLGRKFAPFAAILTYALS